MCVLRKMLATYFQVDLLTLNVNAGQMPSILGGNAQMLQLSPMKRRTLHCKRVSLESLINQVLALMQTGLVHVIGLAKKQNSSCQIHKTERLPESLKQKKELKNHRMEDFGLCGQGKVSSTVAYALVIKYYGRKVRNYLLQGK